MERERKEEQANKGCIIEPVTVVGQPPCKPLEWLPTEWKAELFTCFHPLLASVASEMLTPPNLWALEKDLRQKGGDADARYETWP